MPSYTNSTDTESMILSCLRREKLWDPANYSDRLSYEYTAINDRDESDDKVTHSFIFGTRQKFSQRERVELFQALQEAFGVNSPYAETAGQFCCSVHLSNPERCSYSAYDDYVEYVIEVSYYYDV